MEVEWTVGPIPIEDKHGKEVVLRYASTLESGESTLPKSSNQCPIAYGVQSEAPG